MSSSARMSAGATEKSDLAALKNIRRQIILASAASGEGHIPSAFSVLDILWVLYHQVLRVNPLDPQDPLRDRFVLSKGHASLGLYAVLASKGFFAASELDGFGSFASRLGGHPDMNKVPGIEASTGSLGHGMPVAVGIAMGLRLKESASRVYCLIGDGECNEGSIWEAAMLAPHHGLNNLCCIVDFNHSTDRAVALDRLADRFASFGWDARTVDGHSHAELTLELSNLHGARPTAIIANTVKGWGCAEMEQNPAWHHRSPKASELESLLASLA